MEGNQDLPPLRQAEDEALESSILHWGILIAVVYAVFPDGTRRLADGHNRDRIGTKLGIEIPFIEIHCEPEQFDSLVIELNTCRRQIPEEDWKRIVDDLRAKGFSDRIAAKTAGVPQSKVARYKSSDLVTESSDSVTKSIGQDGKARPRRQRSESTSDRVLRLIRLSEKGMTAPELETDPELGSLSDKGRHQIKELREQGLIRASGKRAGAIIYKARSEDLPPPPPPPKKPRAAMRADKIEEELRSDPEVRQELKDRVAQGKADRKVAATLRTWDQWDEQKKADAGREQERLRKAAIDSIGKSSDYWDKVRKYLDETTKVLALYVREYEHLPTPKPYQVRLTETSLNEFEKVTQHLRDRLPKLIEEEPTFIDAKATKATPKKALSVGSNGRTV
jgi:hypothetical protein